MRSTVLRKGIPLIAVLLILTFSLVFAADNSIKRTKGKVETVDFSKEFFVVNESKYFWNQDTFFSDVKGTPMKVDQLKPQTSVYIEWRSAKGSIKKVAKRVCIFKDME